MNMSAILARYLLVSLCAASSVAVIPPGTTTSSTFAVPPFTQPSTATPPASAAAAAASSARVPLAAKAKSEIINVRAFNTLLTVDGAGQQLLQGDALHERVVFDFGARASVAGMGGRNVQANSAKFP